MSDVCRVYWGHSSCDLPRGHDPEQQARTHRASERAGSTVTVRDAYLFGEDLTEEELRIRAQEWGE